MINYSIYIRTLGQGGEKYARLLKSIDWLVCRPREVVMVLPHGYDLPTERLGYERFAFCEKGMVKQRVFAIADCKTEWVLLLDDDVAFESRFIEELYDAAAKTGADAAIAVLNEVPLQGMEKVKKRLLSWGRHLALAEGTLSSGNYYIRINMAAGHKMLTNIDRSRLYMTESGHGTHCFAKIKALRDIHFEEELWLEESGYALPEDQVFYYKLHLMGYKIVCNPSVYFEHLDAKSTGNIGRRNKLLYATSRNFHIFWRKFIMARADTGFYKFLCRLAINYRHVCELCFIVLPAAIVTQNISFIHSYVSGWRDGVKRQI